jgi:hypothetical protein
MEINNLESDEVDTFDIKDEVLSEPTIEDEINTEVGVFDHIIKMQEENNEYSYESPSNHINNFNETKNHYDDSIQIDGLDSINYQVNNTTPRQEVVFNQSFGNANERNYVSTHEDVESNLSYEKSNVDPQVNISAKQTYTSRTDEFRPFDPNAINVNYSHPVNNNFNIDELENNDSQNRYQQPVGQSTRPQVTNYQNRDDDYYNSYVEAEEDIEQELKALVQVKRHLIDKINYYNSLIQQLELQPDGPEKTMKREEIAIQLKRIKIEFEEYNEIEREVLEHAKSKMR